MALMFVMIASLCYSQTPLWTKKQVDNLQKSKKVATMKSSTLKQKTNVTNATTTGNSTSRQVAPITVNGPTSLNGHANHLLLTPSVAGSPSSIWYFGSNAGLDFKTDPPTPLLDGQVNTFEGCAVISDASGNLMFYTDGITIWAKNHTIMSNGSNLMGDPSSTMSAVIVPNPGNANQYYVFTPSAYGPSNLYYSVVDMSLNGGLGAVTATKNVLLLSGSNEGVNAVKAANGNYWWIITNKENSADFYAYKLETTGINATPVITNIGFTNTGDLGYLNPSPDGKKIAAAYYLEGELQLFDFNASTGVLSNPYLFSFPDAYGCVFSPNSKLLYACGWMGSLNQYDLTNGNALYVVSASSGDGALQNAPNGKIYCAKYGYGTLDVIDNPNVVGAGCSYTLDEQTLGGQLSQGGLPTFVAAYAAPMPPDAPVATAATLITTSSFSANWNVSTSATGYYLDVATDAGFTNFVTGYQNLDVNNVNTYPVSGLTAGTTYYYQIRAYSANGTSGNSNTITVTTNIMAPIAPDAPVATAATLTTCIGFTANWDASATATGYYLDVATDNGFTSFVSGYNNLDVSNVTTYPISGLSSSTAYFYRVRAYNGSGTSGNSNITTVTTGIPAPIAPVATIATLLTSTGFTANWNVSATATGYYLDVAIDNGFTSFVSGYNNLNVNNVTTYLISGLSSNTPYYYRVRAYNVCGTSGNSNIITVTTNPPPPLSPVATPATSVTSTGFSANWNSLADATGYYLDVATNNTFTNFVSGYNNLDVSNVTTYSVSGLTDSTNYYYRVRAYNLYGTSGNSNIIIVLTTGPCPNISYSTNNVELYLNTSMTPLVPTNTGATVHVGGGGTPIIISAPEKGYLDFPFTADGITVTLSGTGSYTNYSSSFTSCDVTTKANSIWLGSSGPATLTNTFSAPVNDLMYRITAANNGEVMTVTTDLGGPITLSYDSGTCSSNNVLIGGQISFTGSMPSMGFGGKVKVHCDNAFTSITFSHNGAGGGSLYTLDFGQLIIGGGGVTGNGHWSISPALPAGLAFDTTNGTISGTPTVLTPATVYTVTATANNCPSTFDITISDALSAPVATAATSVTGTGFDANWNSSLGATGYYLDVATDNGFTNFVSGYNNLNVGNVNTYPVSGLSGSMDYFYRLRAYDGGGTSVNSNTISVLTAPDAPVATAATSVSAIGFNANWDVSTGATGYYLDVATDNGFTNFVSGYNNLNVNNVTTYTVTGLTASMTYYYRIRAYNIGGTSLNSNTIIVLTVPAAPVATAATSVISTSFDANWISSTGATGYYLDVATDNGFTNFVSGYNNLNVNNVNTYSVNGLTASTTYYYRLRAYNTSGTSVNSNTIIVLTVPGAPVATAATSITGTGFDANWNSSTGATGYYLDVATDNGFTTFVSGYNNLNVNNVDTYSVSGLTGSAVYYYRVRAYNGGGTSVNSNIITVLTVPNAPIATAATNVSTGYFDANWLPDFGASGYDIDVATDSVFTFIIPAYNNLNVGNVTTYSITGLTATGQTHLIF